MITLHISCLKQRQSSIVEFKKMEDKKIFDKILSKADILVENFKPGTLENACIKKNKIS